MSAPIRRRPGSTSPLALVPEVEELRTSPDRESTAPAVPAVSADVSPAPAAPFVQETPVAAVMPPTPPVPSAPVVLPVESDQKKAVTFGLRVSLKKRADTAVLRTAGYEGGYKSMAALVEGALERELERLAIEFNDGVPFPQNVGDFRRGRPLGS